MLQLKEINKTNVKPTKRIKDNKWLGRLEPEKSGKTREEHFGRSEKKMHGFNSTRINRECSVPYAANFQRW